MALDIFDGICRQGFWQNRRCPEMITHFLESDGYGFCAAHYAEYMVEVPPDAKPAVAEAYEKSRFRVSNLRAEQAKRQVIDALKTRDFREEDLNWLNLQGHIIRCSVNQ